MKNYTTPRTMAEAQINASFDPIERYERQYPRAWWASFLLTAIAAIVVVVAFR